MAYSFTDIYRPLRTLLRFNGAVIGLGLGLLLFALPRTPLLRWGLLLSEPAWPVRLAGALLITLGVFWLLAAGEEIIGMTTMITTLLGHSLIAIVLLVAYLQREITQLAPIGLALLALIFALCLVGALMPLRYLRAEYRAL